MNTERDRDRSVERLLRQSLRTGTGSAVSGACLDAETLAAWVDGGLRGHDLATTEAHVSQCARCQAMVAALARTPSAVPASQPWWRRGFGLGWLVPLTAGAAAILLWFAQPPPSTPDPTRSGLRQNGRPSEQAEVQTQAAAIPKPEEPALAGRLQAPLVVGEERRAPVDAREKAAKQETASPARADEREARSENRGSQQGQASLDSVGKVAAQAPAAAAPTRARAAESRAAAVSDQAVTLSGQAPAIASEIVSPDRSIRWRIGAAGSVQHSTNGGSTWEVLSAGVVADLTAGVSPSPSVCWLVGRAGTVLLTTDGRRWQRVAFPEATDFAAVQATDARTATVTTADGRTFRTADGGLTWNRL